MLGLRDPNDRVVVAVTPVAPAPGALRKADLLRNAIEEEAGLGSVGRTFLIHAAPEIDPEGRALVEWIVANRHLS